MRLQENGVSMEISRCGLRQEAKSQLLGDIKYQRVSAKYVEPAFGGIFVFRSLPPLPGTGHHAGTSGPHLGRDAPWEYIGHANNVVAMAAINGKLFCATSDKKLWWREPVEWFQ